VLGYPANTALFPYTSPALFTMPAAFLVCWIVSMIDKSRGAAHEREAFVAQYVRSQTGIGAEGAAAH
jgi:cation/acetate symporter